MSAPPLPKPKRVRVLHLLIKHMDSRNPVSRRTGTSTKNVTKDDARKEMQVHLDYLKTCTGPDQLTFRFENLCISRSDCGSYKNYGDLDFFDLGQMQKPFENAAFAMQIGEMSEIVDTDSGPHLILRTG